MTTKASTQVYSHPWDNHLPLRGAAQQPSPTSMTSTPTDSSPTSPRLRNFLNFSVPCQAKQIRPLKTPLYVPAVLRPTEYPSSPMPSPPKSLRASLENLQEEELEAEIVRRAEAEGCSPQELVLSHGFAIEQTLGDVTGLPKRDHWKPDSASPTCDSPKCRSSFSLFTRKHHCRHCGHIFCYSHAPHTIPLDQEARFHPRGNPSRACEHCYLTYRRWDVARNLSRRDSRASSSDGTNLGSGISGSSPVIGKTIPGQPNKNQQEAAQSVPKDWQWSTF